MPVEKSSSSKIPLPFQYPKLPVRDDKRREKMLPIKLDALQHDPKLPEIDKRESLTQINGRMTPSAVDKFRKLPVRKDMERPPMVPQNDSQLFKIAQSLETDQTSCQYLQPAQNRIEPLKLSVASNDTLRNSPASCVMETSTSCREVYTINDGSSSNGDSTSDVDRESTIFSYNSEERMLSFNSSDDSLLDVKKISPG